MNAEQIRKSFVQPELDALSRGEKLDTARLQTLATWELAAQVADLAQMAREGRLDV